MKKYRDVMIKGVCNGILCSLIINVWVILSFYADFNNVVLYLIGLPLGILVFLLMKQPRIKSFLIAWFLSILLFIVTEIVINSLGIVSMFYHKIVGDEIKMTTGDGFGIMIIHIFHYFWIIIGTITAFIVTAMNQRRANQNNQ